MDHSPGPWSVGKVGDDGSIDIEASGPDMPVIAAVWPHDDFTYPLPVAANARLMAAAPALMEACQAAAAILREVADFDWDHCPDLAARLDDVISSVSDAVEHATGEAATDGGE